jgi:hypothetical protein
MRQKIIRVIQVAIASGCVFINAFSQKNTFDFENWPGKNSAVKSNIELAPQFVSKYDLSLAKGSNGRVFFYKIALDGNDQKKLGRLQVQVFSSTEEAQKALVAHLNSKTIDIPPRLTEDEYRVGDVAFGKIYDKIFRLAFTRNNILVIIHAPTKITESIALEMDEKILNAPLSENDTIKPTFILAE